MGRRTQKGSLVCTLPDGKETSSSAGPPWAEDYAQVEFLSDDLLYRELVAEAKADLVVAGWNSRTRAGSRPRSRWRPARRP